MRTAKTGTQIDESMQAKANGHERVCENVRTTLNTPRGKVSCQECERTENWRAKKRRVTRKECKRLREEFEVGGFMAQKR